jgi:putative ABC transport system permease protein
LSDLRYAIRLLFHAPGHTLTAIAALALGIGATVAIFTAVYTALYRPLPLPEPERVVVPVGFHAARGYERASVPYADFADWRADKRLFKSVALYWENAFDLAGEGTPERVPGLLVTEDYFAVMQARSVAGRLLDPGDHTAGAPAVAVIGDGLWRRRFGSDPAVLGRQIRLAGDVTTIVGVADSRVMWPDGLDVWVPLPLAELSAEDLARRDNMIFQAVARIADGTSESEARARVAAIAARVAREEPVTRGGWTTEIVSAKDYLVEPEIKLGMLVLLGGVGLVLLIVCVNLANVTLARGADRTREIALRSALGASRGRIVRQLMTESLLVAGAGGAAGCIASIWLLQGLKAAAPRELTMLEGVQVDGLALAVAVALAVATAVLTGLAPAVVAARHRPAETLREGGRGAGGGRRAARIRDVLVVAEVALAIVLLIGAGLMLRTFSRLLQVDPGVDVERILAGRISIPEARYPRDASTAQFYERLTAALAAHAEVESAAATSFLPAGGRGFGLRRVFLLEGQPEPPATSDHPAQWNVVTSDYFRTMGIPVLKGRSFNSRHTEASPPVMVINETMARRVFGNENPLGRRMRSWRDENLLREIVGVVGDVRYSGLADEDVSLVYVPHRQNIWGSLTIAVRARGNPAALAELLRREVAAIDPDIAVARVDTLESFAAESISGQRFGALLLGLFAVAAALLAGIGVYGVMSYAVARRSHELGVRLALGATPASLFALVVRHGLLLAGIGTLFGIAGGIGLGRLMRGLLYGVEPADPATLVAVPIVIAAIATAACALPGRRAARTEPLTALKAE